MSFNSNGFFGRMAVFAQKVGTLTDALTTSNADDHDSAMMRAFIRVKMRSSSVIPANSAVSSEVSSSDFCRSTSVSRRSWS
jgi:hypothetical protein